jgi:hypothetical protein
MYVGELREILAVLDPDLHVSTVVDTPEGPLQGYEIETKLVACACGHCENVFLEIVATDIEEVVPVSVILAGVEDSIPLGGI